ncbi:MAG: hypothetical protein IPK19_10405 [Chloroflexi bacterium]|nr:hypothetical protein [Chloroflexota bacterium]
MLRGNRFDAPDQTLIPGLIDTHFHLFLLLLKKPVGGASEVTHMTNEMNRRQGLQSR